MKQAFKKLGELMGILVTLFTSWIVIVGIVSLAVAAITIVLDNGQLHLEPGFAFVLVLFCWVLWSVIADRLLSRRLPIGKL